MLFSTNYLLHLPLPLCLFLFEQVVKELSIGEAALHVLAVEVQRAWLLAFGSAFFRIEVLIQLSFKLLKELLGVRSNIFDVTSTNMDLYQRPVFVVNPECLQEPIVLLGRPSAHQLLLRCGISGVFTRLVFLIHI